MAVTTTTTWANGIKEVYTPGKLVDLAFHNRTLFDFSEFPMGKFDPAAAGFGAPRGLFPVVPSRGGNSWNWPVSYSTTAAEAYVEGQGAPAPGNTTLLMAEQPYSTGYFQRVVELSGHTLDQCRGEAEILSAFDVELSKAIDSIVDAINTTALGTSFLELAVDSAGTYAGINRSTYTGWGSWENPLSGALSKAALQDMIEAVMDNDRGASLEDMLFLCPVNQLTNYAALAGAGAGTPIMSAGGTKLDLGFASYSFAGIPVVGIPDMTDTIVLLVHRPSIYGVMQRPLQIEQKPTSGDSYQWLLTCSLVLVCERPFLCAKQTAVTA